ncbi:uncharacterized protein LOC141630982 [Silene latifolia]|uniref:uncharacterized protein LOC141630982 n=1 Tax=Silene latifolia TaxID=37657 RepID=UPI003D7712AE
MFESLTGMMQKESQAREASTKMLETQIAQLAGDELEGVMVGKGGKAAGKGKKKKSRSLIWVLGRSFAITMGYAFNGASNRRPLWERLVHFSHLMREPWAICGDFNTVLSPAERLGGNSTMEEIEEFKACVDECGVLDSPAIGSLFTWCNKHEPSSRVYSRLDRVLVNQDWLTQRPQAYAHFYCEGIFDHIPCVVQAKIVGSQKRRSFKYFNMWSSSEGFQDCVKLHWNRNWIGTKMYVLIKKLKSLKCPLKQLNNDDFDDIENNASRASMNLEFLQNEIRKDPLNTDLILKELEAANSVRFLHSACHDFLLQKSKAIWVEKGDTNSKYFHTVIKGKQNKTKVMKIENLQGVMCEDVEDIQNAFTDFYIGLLGTTSPTVKGYLGYCGGDSVRLSNIFFTLNVTQFRPISCCNVVYKCISKLLCNRISEVLPHIISDSQGGFIKGRSIVENILICQDVVRCYNRKSVSPRFMLKVDLKKAYDSVNWNFLHQMLIYLNFPQKIIDLVMECVQTASYSLVLNGETFGFFNGAKGLRQGDPLSPLLFTIGMEYLSRIMAYTTEHMNFKYHPLYGQLKLSHLMFADDLLLLSKGDVSSIMVLLRSFATFSVASGLQMNNTKTCAYFNRVLGWVKKDILQIYGVIESQLPFRYLGVPITCGRMSKGDCNILVEKLVRRIRSFGTKKLSYSGRLVLVNSVLTALYSYWINIFVIPKGVLNKVNAICRNYLWDGSPDFIRVPRVSWAKVCAPKSEGGLGIKDSIIWNHASIGKLVWWVYCSPDRLWVKWVNQLYIKGRD